MIRETQYVIAVHDLKKSADFYRDALGFEIRELDAGWRLYVKDGCRILAGECPGALPPRELGDHSYFAYFVVDDVEAWHARALAASVELLKPLRDEPWGLREFGLRTIDGHRIMIGQRIV